MGGDSNVGLRCEGKCLKLVKLQCPMCPKSSKRFDSPPEKTDTSGNLMKLILGAKIMLLLIYQTSTVTSAEYYALKYASNQDSCRLSRLIWPS